MDDIKLLKHQNGSISQCDVANCAAKKREEYFEVRLDADNISLMDEINILKRKVEYISQSNTVNHLEPKSEEYLEVKSDAKTQTTNSNNYDPFIFEDAYEDHERQISVFGNAFNNAFIRNINNGNDYRKRRFSTTVAPDESWITDSRSHMTQLSNLNSIQSRMTLTKQTGKAFAQQLAGNAAFTRRPFPSSDTLKSLAAVPSSYIFMPKTDGRDVSFKSCDMELGISATAANHEAKNDSVNLNIAPLTKTEKAKLVISNASICDARFLRNIQPPLLLPSQKISGVTFVGDDEITDADILSGRGGKSNHHVGNKRFRHLVSEMKTIYRSTDQKTDKTALSRGIIEYVHSYGGRFLIQDRTANGRQWRVMTTIEARKKTSQALRETKLLKWILESSPSSLTGPT